VATTLVFVLLVAGGLTINVSAGSLPGDKLYGVKRTWESLRLSLTPNDEIRQKLQERFAAERLDEIDELILHRRAEIVEFAAPLEAMDAESWKVDGFQIKVAPTTYIVGIPKLGEMVYVRARLLADGTLIALQVRVPGQTLPTPFATITPVPSLTPKVFKDHPTETLEPSLAPQEPSETDEPTVRPTREPGNEASPTLNQNTQTPESTEEQEPEEDGTHQPTAAPLLTHTSEATAQATTEATEQPHEDLEATAHSPRTPEATEPKPHTPEATDGD
jgi:hypothetical protein